MATLQRLINNLTTIVDKQSAIIQGQEQTLADSVKLIQQLQSKADAMEVTMAEQLKMQADILSNQALQDEVSAQILLNQMEVGDSV